MSSYSQTLIQSCQGGSHQTACLYLPPPHCPHPHPIPAPLRLHARAHSSFAVSEVWRPVPHHVQVWGPEGAAEELQPLLLQQLQSGKAVLVLVRTSPVVSRRAPVELLVGPRAASQVELSCVRAVAEGPASEPALCSMLERWTCLERGVIRACSETDPIKACRER